jgi:hypothetical protein
MTTYTALYEFTDEGLSLFERAMSGEIPEEAVNPIDAKIAQPLDATGPFEVADFQTAQEMATAIIEAAGTRSIQELIHGNGLWAWLTFILRDVLFPADVNGQRKLGEVHRWFPSNPDDFQKAQRHLVRMPVVLQLSLGPDADYLLCGPPSVLPEIREQMTSQQDMFDLNFQRAARNLYFDASAGKLKKGIAGKGGGSARRLATVRKQFDVTWNLFDVTPDRLLEMLPREFDRFKSDNTPPTKPVREVSSAQRL